MGGWLPRLWITPGEALAMPGLLTTLLLLCVLAMLAGLFAGGRGPAWRGAGLFAGGLIGAGLLIGADLWQVLS